MAANSLFAKLDSMSSSTRSLHPAFWKALSAVLLLIVIIQQFSSTSVVRERIFNSPSSEQTPHHRPPHDVHYENTESNHDGTYSPPAVTHAVNKTWSYEWERDSYDHGLSSEQCDIAFPDLYAEIHRATNKWRSKKITPESIDLFEGNDGGVRILINNQQVRILLTKGMHREDFRHRIIAVLNQILRALTSVEGIDAPMPEMEFTVVVDDKAVLDEEPGPLWTFARKVSNPRHDNLWVIPDFHFFGAPPEAEGFRLQQEKSRQHDSELASKIPKVVWRGVEWTNPDIRVPLLKVTAGKPWADVVAMSWDNKDAVMPMDSFCKYRYTVNTEGRAWSARLTHLLNCDSMLFVHDVEWLAHYYHLLDTETNCVRVERNFTDLEEKIDHYNNHLEEAQMIADTARMTFRERYTSPAATACYWRKLLRAWSEVSFKPITTVGKESRPRGISFEEFIVHDNTVDFPYVAKKDEPAT